MTIHLQTIDNYIPQPTANFLSENKQIPEDSRRADEYKKIQDLFFRKRLLITGIKTCLKKLPTFSPKNADKLTKEYLNPFRHELQDVDFEINMIIIDFSFANPNG